MKGVIVTALLDTGASRTILRRDIYDVIQRATHSPTLLKPSPNLKTLCGNHMITLGETELPVAHAKPINVIVVENMDQELVLGNDNVQLGNSVINFRDRELVWYGERWPLLFSDAAGIAGLSETTIATGYEDIDKIIETYDDVFSGKFEGNGQCNLKPAFIETKGPPICQKPYRLPLHRRQIVEEQIDKMLKEGTIRPSNSPWASPVTLVPKKDLSIRFCLDYRRLNAVTKKDKYPLPNIQDIFDSLGGNMYYTTLDIKNAYHQIPMEESSIEKTAFVCHRGLYEFVNMPFGLTNAPSIFQRTMDFVLAEYIGKFVYAYIDDVIIASKTKEEHARHLAQVFQCLRESGFKLKPSKCHFAKSEVELLGFIVSGEGIRANPAKTKAISELPQPRNLKELRSFLGMANYYRQFLQNYAKIAEPLVRLTKKSEPFRWENEQEKAFETMKAMLISPPVMAYPRLDLPYRLYTDACNYAIGGILVQEHEDGIEHVIQYVSHQLNGPQSRYSVIEKEAYAVIYCIEKLRPYLLGAEFKVLTDHKPLTCLFTKQMVNTRIQRWAVFLAEYGAKIEYRKGLHHIRADMLSRISDRSCDIASDTVAAVDWVDPNSISDDEPEKNIPLEHDGLNLRDISEYQQIDFVNEWAEAELSEYTEYMLSSEILYSVRRPSPTSAEYPRLMLPIKYRAQVIDRAHREVGHMGTEKTLHRICEAYVWQSMRKSIREHLRKCAVCLTHHRKKQYLPMGEMPLPVSPMQVVGMDLIGPFPTSSKGNKYILMMIDHHSGWGEAFPIPDKSNKSVWTAFANEFIPRHSVPYVIITDNGMEFMARPFRQYLKDLGIEHRRITPYNARCQGKVERYNKSFKHTLSKLVNNHSAHWEDRVADVLVAHHHSVSSVTLHTPFFIMYGRRPRIPFSTLLQVNPEINIFNNRLDDLATTFREARERTEESRKYNRARLLKKANVGKIDIGDSVMVLAEERLTLTSRHDPLWEVFRVRGPVCWIRNQFSGKTKTINREKLTLVDPNLPWDELRQRPIRKSNKTSISTLSTPETVFFPQFTKPQLTKLDDGLGGRHVDVPSKKNG